MFELFPVAADTEFVKSATDLTRRIAVDVHARKRVQFTVLNCAFIFLSDSVRHITIPEKVDFKHAARFVFNTHSAGNTCEPWIAGSTIEAPAYGA